MPRAAREAEQVDLGSRSHPLRRRPAATATATRPMTGMVKFMERPSGRLAPRLAAHESMSTRLSLLSDHQLAQIVAAGEPLESGIGGRLAMLGVAGRRVFVKRVALTDLKTAPEQRAIDGEPAPTSVVLRVRRGLGRVRRLA